MKKYIIGVFVGIAVSMSTVVLADSNIEQITAYLKKDMMVKVDGKTVSLTNTPLVYDGTSYLPVRETAALLGKTVTWDDTTQTASIGGAKLVKFKNMEALEFNGSLYFKTKDFSDLYDTKQKNLWEIKNGEITFFNADGSIKLTASLTDQNYVYIQNGESYINSNVFPSQAKEK